MLVGASSMRDLTPSSKKCKRNDVRSTQKIKITMLKLSNGIKDKYPKPTLFLTEPWLPSSIEEYEWKESALCPFVVRFTCMI